MKLFSNVKNKYNKKSLFKEGNKYLKEEKFDKALKCFDKDLEADSKNVKILYNKGLIYAKNKKIQEALGHFDKALKLNPDFEPAKKSKNLIKSVHKIS